jgi:hypothetical protein
MKKSTNILVSFRNRILLAISILILSTFISQEVSSQTWSPVGGGMNDWVYASIIYNGELIVGGKFTSAGGVSANHIAKWDGTSWEPLGLGVNGKVNALIEFNGSLVVAGEFTSAGGMDVNFIAQWDGTSWNDELGGVGSTVTSLAVFGNQLYAGGYFVEADNTPVNYIAKRGNGGWEALGSGMGGSQGQVMALTVYNGELYAGGFFTTAGGMSANHIAKWNGSSWSSLGTGIGGIVYTLGEYNGNLIAGGLFLSAGSSPANHIASWNGTAWSALGSGMAGIFYQYVFALSVYNGKLIAGGYFTSSGGVSTNGIAQWDGSSWSGMNGGFFYPANVYGAHTFCIYGSDLIVGGLFSSASGTVASHIAAWNEILPTSQTLAITAFLEGFYNPLTGWMNQAQNTDINGFIVNNFPGTIVDTLSLLLAGATAPYSIAYESAGIDLTTDGSISLLLPASLTGSYYIIIKHRNSLETWSANPVTLNGSATNYDFSTSASMAYGNNLLPISGTYCIYAGDVVSDGLVDSSDMIGVDNDVSSFAVGYVSSDVNGDGLTDSSDMILVDNNAGSFAGAMHP